MPSKSNTTPDGHDDRGMHSLELEEFADVTSLLQSPPEMKRKMPWFPIFTSRKFEYKDPLPQSSLPRGFRMEDDDDGVTGRGPKDGVWKQIWSSGSFDKFRKQRQNYFSLETGEGEWCIRDNFNIEDANLETM